ncbi:NAD(P)H-quinone oxidoreductase subunit L, chloroplastic [Vicia villosa]|uniref:NAD(P)H-quinone oxidoreductase subunit L, chloroplastic n=1 Tax=Vicia villosa TaxID=3911 RepID=UPI00273BE5CB|nr:NAD(P)H-quinone oxidoreductase subunit L, chloroplastic [Vicia villosa]
MSCSFSLHVPKALPPLPYYSSSPSLFIASKHKPFHNNTTPPSNQLQIVKCSSQKPNDHVTLKKPNLALPIGAVLLALAEHPAASLAVTGANNHPQELSWILIQLGIVFFFYFLTAPPLILFWLYKRWYRRKLVEMYFQFMCVFIFFPAILVWVPFLNVRKFPRDPDMQYPWSVPEDPSKIRTAFYKYPIADPEDYD